MNLRGQTAGFAETELRVDHQHVLRAGDHGGVHIVSVHASAGVNLQLELRLCAGSSRERDGGEKYLGFHFPHLMLRKFVRRVKAVGDDTLKFERIRHYTNEVLERSVIARVLACCVAAPLLCSGQQPRDVLDKYCVTCHSQELPTGGLSLEA